MMKERYYTGKFFVVFLVATLFAILTLLVSMMPFGDTDAIFLSADEISATEGSPMATTGFMIGIFGGGTAIMLAGWYLARK